MTGLITRVQRGTNAELIATAQALYPMDGGVLDLTPGDKQGFWTRHQPVGLVKLGPPPPVIVAAGCVAVGIDFRRVPWPGATFDHVVFDPPYVAKGGHKTSTIKEMNDRYGMLHVERTPALQWSRQIVPGLCEAHRLLVDGGLVWFKCMDYVDGGKTHWFTKRALAMFESTGWFELVDEFILDGHPGPQPTVNLDGTPRRQVHARNAHSVLMIARKR